MKVINPWKHELPGFGAVPISHGVVCAPKQMMFVSGQVSEDPETKETVGKGDFPAQFRQVHENIKRVLKEGGFTMGEVVKRQLFLSEEGAEKIQDPEVAGQMLEMMKEYFPEPHPPHSFWVAKSLAHPDYLLELEVIAVKE